MPSSERLALIADLAAAFPLDRLPAETVTLYVRMVEDIPVDVLADAILALISTARRFPPVSAIREAAAEVMLALPTEHEALDSVNNRIAWGRSGVEGAPPPPIHPLVQRAVSDVGGFYAIRSAETPSVIRGQFLKLYRDERAAAIRSAMTVVRALPSGEQPKRALS